MTLVWLSPALPADRTELAASLPPELSLFSMPSLDDQAAIDGLAVGSLCVATVFEPELLEKLATRPEGVRLLVVGPPDYPGPLPTPTVGRPPDAMSPTSSLTDLAAAIGQAASGSADTAEMAAGTGSIAAAPARSRLRSRYAAIGTVLAGLAIGGIVIGVTEGSSAASASNGLNNGARGGFNGGQFPGGQGGGQGGQFPGGGNGNFGPGGGTFNGQNGTGQNGTGGFDPDAIEQRILTCLRSKGFTGSADQLRLRAADPQLRQAFAACIQQLGSASSQLSGRP